MASHRPSRPNSRGAGANVTGWRGRSLFFVRALSAGRGRRGDHADVRARRRSSPTCITPFDPTVDQRRAPRSPSPAARIWLGADFMGRDMYSRIVYGARISLAVGIGATALGCLIGVVDRPDVAAISAAGST